MVIGISEWTMDKNILQIAIDENNYLINREKVCSLKNNVLLYLTTGLVITLISAYSFLQGLHLFCDNKFLNASVCVFYAGLLFFAFLCFAHRGNDRRSINACIFAVIISTYIESRQHYFFACGANLIVSKISSIIPSKDYFLLNEIRYPEMLHDGTGEQLSGLRFRIMLQVKLVGSLRLRRPGIFPYQDSCFISFQERIGDRFNVALLRPLKCVQKIDLEKAQRDGWSHQLIGNEWLLMWQENLPFK
jgi:hypothetical protein